MKQKAAQLLIVALIFTEIYCGKKKVEKIEGEGKATATTNAVLENRAEFLEGNWIAIDDNEDADKKMQTQLVEEVQMKIKREKNGYELTCQNTGYTYNFKQAEITCRSKEKECKISDQVSKETLFQIEIINEKKMKIIFALDMLRFDHDKEKDTAMPVFSKGYIFIKQ